MTYRLWCAFPVIDENRGGKRKYSQKGRRKYASFPCTSLQEEHRPSRQSPGSAARQTGKWQGRYEVTARYRTAAKNLAQWNSRDSRALPRPDCPAYPPAIFESLLLAGNPKRQTLRSV